jgi:hypothetical protein
MEKKKDSTLTVCENKNLRKIIIEKNNIEAGNYGIFKQELLDFIKMKKKYYKNKKKDDSPIMTRCA